MAKTNDKKKAFLRASVEMLEQAKDAVRDKYNQYDGTEDTMEHIVELIDTGKEINMAYARNAGYSEDDLKDAEYTKVNGLEVEKYRRHLEKRGMTDEQMREKAYGSVELPTVTASSETKKKKSKGIFSFSKKKKKIIQAEENTSSFNIPNRNVIGEGYSDEKVKTPHIEDDTISEEPKEEVKYDVTENVNKVYNKPKVTSKNTVSVSDFDMNYVSPLTRYDIIELPSHGECYPSKKGRLPVRELTAADENLIASPNMYVSGTLIDTLIRRCVLDNSFDTEQLCDGDRDAIVLWLRATAFGQEYNIGVINPENSKKYTVTIKLGDFKYKEFDLKGDDNGLFEYTFENGDIAKFKILSYKENQQLQEEIANKYVDQKKYIVYKLINDIKRQVSEIFKEELEDEPLNDAVDYIIDWSNKGIVDGGYEEKLYDEFVTKNLSSRTVSINGNNDKEYINTYINSLRLSESKKYREYIFNNSPGFDFSFEVPIPESDGGGSFTSFLRYDDTIFLQ